MSIPVVANKLPVPGSVAGVRDASRFSLRDQDLKINRSSINCYLGSGGAIYKGSVLPEDDPNTSFRLGTLAGTTSNFATREIGIENELVITKDLAATNQRGLYFFGGLETPADPDASLMLEFTLKLAEADVVVDADDFTGVMAGFKINSTGAVIRFMSDGATRRIELHTAAFGSGVPIASGVFDWDTGNPETYKLLWNPLTGVVKFFVSQGQESLTSDILLIDGDYADFILTLPAEEIPENEPQAFFGHGYPDPTSVSRWYSVYFLHKVTTPIVGGIPRGSHEGFVATNEVTEYIPTDLPDRVGKAWNPISDSYGTVGGGAVVANEILTLNRVELGESNGYYRNEPKVASDVTVLDFEVSGSAQSIEPGEVATGMEVFLATDTREIRFNLLDEGGNQYVGLLQAAGSPELLSSYLAVQSGWAITRSYRLIVDPSGDVVLVQLVPGEEGIVEELVVTDAYSNFPATGSLPASAIGFLNNALSSNARTQFSLSRVRYSTDVRLYDGTALPAAPWIPVGAGSGSVDSGILTIDDGSPSDFLLYLRPDAAISPADGLMAEFRMRVDSYGADNPIRSNTGVAFSIDDGTDQYILVFADKGPPEGRIVFLATSADLDQNLLDIRSGLLKETFAVVDWSAFHMYRFVKGVNGLIQLFVDNSKEAVIEIEEATFTPVPTAGGGSNVIFGNTSSEIQSLSSWEYVRYTASQGYDVSVYPILTEEEQLSRFDHAVNLIVEAEDTA